MQVQPGFFGLGFGLTFFFLTSARKGSGVIGRWWALASLFWFFGWGSCLPVFVQSKHDRADLSVWKDSSYGIYRCCIFPSYSNSRVNTLEQKALYPIMTHGDVNVARKSIINCNLLFHNYHHFHLKALRLCWYFPWSHFWGSSMCHYIHEERRRKRAKWRVPHDALAAVRALTSVTAWPSSGPTSGCSPGTGRSAPLQLLICSDFLAACSFFVLLARPFFYF